MLTLPSVTEEIGEGEAYFGRKKCQYTCNEPGVKHLPFDTSQAATVGFIVLLSSLSSQPSLALSLFFYFYNLHFPLWGASPWSVCDQSPVSDDSLYSQSYVQVWTWKTGLSWVAASSLNSAMRIVGNKSLLAIGISVQCGDKRPIENMGKNYIQCGACNLNRPSTTPEWARIAPESSAVWSLSAKSCYWLLSFLFLPSTTPWTVTRMNKVVSQSRIWSPSVSYGLQEWTGLLLVSYWELMSCLSGLLLSLWNNTCL